METTRIERTRIEPTDSMTPQELLEAANVIMNRVAADPERLPFAEAVRINTLLLEAERTGRDYDWEVLEVAILQFQEAHGDA